MTYELYEISAVRSDGLQCAGTIEAENLDQAKLECHRIFSPFRAKRAGINCPVHKGVCKLHTGELFTFSSHAVKVSASAS